MGYKINSTWQKQHAKDINKLNEIIDYEYGKDLEIANKIHIMKTFERKFQEVISEINFDAIEKFMQMTNWTWAFFDDGYSERVPVRSEMINMIRKNFLKPGLFEIIEHNKKHYSSSTGGFVFNMGITSDYAHEDTVYIDILFDIAHHIED